MKRRDFLKALAVAPVAAPAVIEAAKAAPIVEAVRPVAELPGGNGAFYYAGGMGFVSAPNAAEARKVLGLDFIEGEEKR